jgi:hypothetical protein
MATLHAPHEALDPAHLTGLLARAMHSAANLLDAEAARLEARRTTRALLRVDRRVAGRLPSLGALTTAARGGRTLDGDPPQVHRDY